MALRPWRSNLTATRIRAPLTGDTIWSAGEQQLLARKPSLPPANRPITLLAWLQNLVSRDHDAFVCYMLEARLGIPLRHHAAALQALSDTEFTAVTSLDLSQLCDSRRQALLPLAVAHAKLLACELARRRIALLHIALHHPIPDIADFRTDIVTTTRFFQYALVAPGRALHTIMGQAIRPDDTLASFLDRLVHNRLLSPRARKTLHRLVDEILAERAAAWTRHTTLGKLDRQCRIHVVATSTDLAQFHSKGARDVAGKTDKAPHREGAFGAMTFVEARLGIAHNDAAVLVGMSLLTAARTLDRLAACSPHVILDASDTLLPGKHSYPEVALIEVVDALRCDGRLDRYARRTAGTYIGTQSRDLVRDALDRFRIQDPIYARAVLQIDPRGWISVPAKTSQHPRTMCAGESMTLVDDARPAPLAQRCERSADRRALGAGAIARPTSGARARDARACIEHGGTLLAAKSGPERATDTNPVTTE